MDFSSFTRRELQALCKKNKLPANVTNVAMADSLSALEHVEGLEELLNQSPEKTMSGSLSIVRTTGRTSTRRKPVISEEPESSQPLTRSRRPTTRRAASEEVEQEKTEVPKTPAAPNTRRRAPAASACQKTETQNEEKASVQSVYNTRRSVRLLEKTMANLSLDYAKSMPFKMDDLSTEINNGSEISEGLLDQGSNMQTSSEASSETVDVSKESKSNGTLDNEGSNDKTDVIEVGDESKPKSELEAEVSVAKSGSDVIAVSKVMDESHEEGSDEADDKEPRVKGAGDSVTAKVSDEVMGHVTAGEEAENPEEESQSLAVKETDISEDQDFKNEESDSKSPTLGGTEEVKNLTAIEEASEQEALTLSLSDEQQHVISSKDFDMRGAEGDYSGTFDFESDSVTEEGSDGSSTEGESAEDEANESTEDLDDAHMTEVAEVAMETLLTPHFTKMQKLNNSEADSEGAASLGKAPTLPPLAADQLALQFPRPALSKPGKSSGKEQSEILSFIFDDNEENIDSSDKMMDNGGGVEMKSDDDTTNKDNKDIMVKEIETKSLRQLKKMLKQKLNIGEDKLVEKPRTALQEVAENQIA